MTTVLYMQLSNKSTITPFAVKVGDNQIETIYISLNRSMNQQAIENQLSFQICKKYKLAPTDLTFKQASMS